MIPADPRSARLQVYGGGRPLGPSGLPGNLRPRVITMTNFPLPRSRQRHSPRRDATAPAAATPASWPVAARGRTTLAGLKSLAAVAGLAALAGLTALATPAQAGALYGNFDPFAVTPDYSTTQYADLSGSCNGAIGCTWINAYSASFDFTAQASGTLSKAWLPMLATYTLPGAERIFGLTITNGDGKIVARGGFYGRDAPIGSMLVYEIDLFASTHAGQPVPNGVLADDPLELVAGETYTAHFGHTYGSMSGAQWMKSDEVPGAGQARVHCQTNAGGLCAVWDWGLNNWRYTIGPSYTAAMTDYLPALYLGGAVADPPPPSAVAEPSSAALLLAAGMAAAWARRRRP